MFFAEYPIYVGFLFAGIAGSLHCLGMCGPILVAATNIVSVDEVRVQGKPLRTVTQRATSQLWYHLGRLLTYALLGFLAGRIGASLIETTWFDRSQHYLGTAAAGLAALFGFGMLAVRFLQYRNARAAAKNGETGKTKAGLCARVFTTSFHSLAATQSIEGKLLLGALMGFLPCGLVYAMLPLAAATASPLQAALAMVAFGLGTIPALSAVVVAGNLLPVGIRKYGEQFAAIIIILIAGFMMYRAWPHGADVAPGSCPMCDLEEGATG